MIPDHCPGVVPVGASVMLFVETGQTSVEYYKIVPGEKRRQTPRIEDGATMQLGESTQPQHTASGIDCSFRHRQSMFSSHIMVVQVRSFLSSGACFAANLCCVLAIARGIFFLGRAQMPCPEPTSARVRI